MDNETYDRGQKIRMQLDQMIDTLKGMDVGLPLVWLYTWDLMRSAYIDMSEDAEVYTRGNPEFNIDDVWNKLWEEPFGSIEYGAEQLDEDIRNWLISNNFIIPIEEEDNE